MGNLLLTWHLDQRLISDVYSEPYQLSNIVRKDGGWGWGGWGGGHSPFFLNHPPLYPTCPLFKTFNSPPHFILTPFKIFYTISPSQPSTTNPPISSNTPTTPKPSHWKYLFPATHHNHLNFDDTNQNLIHVIFPFCYNKSLPLLLRMNFLYKIADEEKNKFMFKHVTQS